MPKKKPNRRSTATSEFLLPQPTAEDVRKLRAAYRKRTGGDVSVTEAKEVLTRISRFMYMNMLMAFEQGVPEEGGNTAPVQDAVERGHEDTREPGETEENASREVVARRADGTVGAGLPMRPG